VGEDVIITEMEKLTRSQGTKVSNYPTQSVARDDT
jgi:hypothetical protein